MVALNAKVPAALRAAVKVQSRRGPDVQFFIAAASYWAMRHPEQREAMLDEYEQWLDRGCPPIKAERSPPGKANAPNASDQGMSRRKRRTG